MVVPKVICSQNGPVQEVTNRTIQKFSTLTMEYDTLIQSSSSFFRTVLKQYQPDNIR